ncbi:hypothetical protein D3C75_720940 [compost metagenome]
MVKYHHIKADCRQLSDQLMERSRHRTDDHDPVGDGAVCLLRIHARREKPSDFVLFLRRQLVCALHEAHTPFSNNWS